MFCGYIVLITMHLLKNSFWENLFVILLKIYGVLWSLLPILSNLSANTKMYCICVRSEHGERYIRLVLAVISLLLFVNLAGLECWLNAGSSYVNVGTALDHLWSHLSYFLVNIGRNICTSERSGQAVCSLDSGFLAKLLLLVLRRSVDRAADTSDYFRGIPFNRDWTAQISLQLIVRDISWVAIWHYYHSITCMELQTTKLPIDVHMPEEHSYKYMTCTV